MSDIMTPEKAAIKGMECALDDYTSGRVLPDYYGENIMDSGDPRLEGLAPEYKRIVRNNYELWFSLKKSGY